MKSDVKPDFLEKERLYILVLYCAPWGEANLCPNIWTDPKTDTNLEN